MSTEIEKPIGNPSANVALVLGISALVITLVFFLWASVPPVNYKHVDPRADSIDLVFGTSCIANILAVVLSLILAVRVSKVSNRSRFNKAFLGTAIAVLSLLLLLSCGTLINIAISFAGSGD